MGIFDYFKAVLTAQLFWAFSVTLLIYGLSQVTTLTPVALFTDNVGLEINDIRDRVDVGFDEQLELPLVDLGSLVFFSGNLLADLILNFITAVPNIVNLFLAGLFTFLPIDSQLQTLVKVFITVFGTILYLIGIFALLTDSRTGRSI